MQSADREDAAHCMVLLKLGPMQSLLHRIWGAFRHYETRHASFQSCRIKRVGLQRKRHLLRHGGCTGPSHAPAASPAPLGCSRGPRLQSPGSCSCPGSCTSTGCLSWPEPCTPCRISPPVCGERSQYGCRCTCVCCTTLSCITAACKQWASMPCSLACQVGLQIQSLESGAENGM